MADVISIVQPTTKQQAASEGRSPVPPETVRSWLHEVLRN